MKSAINSHANKFLSANVLDCWAGMESNFNPRAQTGSHKGLFQLNNAAWTDSGIGVAFNNANAFNASTNTQAAVDYLTNILENYVGVSASDISSGNVTTAQLSQALTDFRWGPNASNPSTTYANDIMNCANDLGAGNWDKAMSDLGR